MPFAFDIKIGGINIEIDINSGPNNGQLPMFNQIGNQQIHQNHHPMQPMQQMAMPIFQMPNQIKQEHHQEQHHNHHHHHPQHQEQQVFYPPPQMFQEVPAPVVYQAPAPIVEQVQAPVVVEAPAPIVERAPEPVVEQAPVAAALVVDLVPAMAALSVFETTVQPLSSQEVADLVLRAHTAMKGLGCDNASLINILGNLHASNAGQLNHAYKANYAKSLYEAVGNETSGNYGKLAELCCLPVAECAAIELKAAMKGAGTDESALIDVLVGCNNAEMAEIKAAFQALYSQNLEHQVAKETHGNFGKALIALLQGQRNEGGEWNVQDDVDLLYRSGEGRIGCDVGEFISVLCTRPGGHLRAVFEGYTRTHNKDIARVIKSETGSDLEHVLLAIVKSIRDHPAYIAESIESAMSGIGMDG
ncbi:hypothetical protein SmJEL517_g02899 [Synchytrium microbalum]|uniref:Annexin n=1 Tax=Synchytrium microbalum TaxID=1806994 RepID=A0A507C4Y2_9FUNG|nr:uncharacterized protein SmJEL517_g02899 [Synchytrium microbalum]TPX34541.1 hypothetical protein SmJEL517_g02899 [Synchytrium microbalum]